MKIIEHLGNGFGIGNSVNLGAEENNKLAIATSANLSEQNITENMNSFINETISNTILNNSLKLKTMVRQINEINLEFGKDRRNQCPQAEVVNITGIKQEADVKVSQRTEMINTIKQEITSDIKNDIKSSIIRISDIFDSGINIANSFPEVMEAGFEGVEDMGGSADTVFISALGGAGIGNSYNANKTVNSDGDFKMAMGMDSNDVVVDDQELLNQIESSINVGSITRITNDILQNNNFSVDVNQCVNRVNISDIEQINESNLVIESTALNEVVSKLSTSIVSNVDRLIKKIAEKSNNKLAVAKMGLAAGMGVVASGGKYRDANGNVVDEKNPVVHNCNENSNCRNHNQPEESGSGNSGKEKSNLLLYGVIGFVILIVIIVIMNSNKGDEYDYDYYNKYLIIPNNQL